MELLGEPIISGERTNSARRDEGDHTSPGSECSAGPGSGGNGPALRSSPQAELGTNIPRPAGYIANARTVEEHFHNVRFQADNVEGYLMMAAEREDRGGRKAAAIKAQCLLEAAQCLVAAFEAEERAEREAA